MTDLYSHLERFRLNNIYIHIFAPVYSNFYISDPNSVALLNKVQSNSVYSKYFFAAKNVKRSDEN